MFRIILLILVLSMSVKSHSQDIELMDSLKQVIEDVESHDTLKIRALIKKSAIQNYRRELVASDLDLALETAEKGNWESHKAEVLGCFASVEYYEGNYPAAITYQEQIVAIRKKQNKPNRYAGALGNLGILYRRIGQLAKSLECYQSELNIRLEMRDVKGVASVYNNLGNLYSTKGDHAQALIFHRKALRTRLENLDTTSYGSSYHNIGMVFDNLEELDSALHYYKLAMQYVDQSENIRLRGNSLNNSAVVYEHLKDYDQAEIKHLEALAYRRKINDYAGISQSLVNLAGICERKNEDARAIKYANESLSYSMKYRLSSDVYLAYKVLARCYQKQGRFEMALDYYIKFRELKDSTDQSDQIQEMNKTELSLQYERKFLEDSLYEAQKYQEQHFADSLAELNRTQIREFEFKQEKERQASYLWISAIGGFILLILAVVLFRSNRNKQKSNQIISTQKEQVELQKEILEERNKEILDSINYASRLQQAILPKSETIKKHFPDSFVIYRPKDIVAGDFYWMEYLENADKQYKLIAAADCTGHGVPGAMVSVVCANALNKAVGELGLIDPGDILNATRQEVIKHFDNGDEEVKDGMDIALCALDGSTLKYAGAHNPLWIVRSGSKELEEIKADKQPVGVFEAAQPYTTHEIDLQKGDRVYLFSDGFADQFGGEKGKKFKSSNFKKLISSVQSISMNEQKIKLEQTFDEWKGDLEQLDDLCILGFEYNGD